MIYKAHKVLPGTTKKAKNLIREEINKEIKVKPNRYPCGASIKPTREAQQTSFR